MTNPYLFRPRSVWISAVVAFSFTWILVIQTIVASSLQTSLIAIALGILVSDGAYLLFVRPKIEYFDEGLVITNPLFRVRVGWDQVEALEAKYAMSVQVDGKTTYAWAAPAPGRYHARSVHPTEIKGLSVGQTGQMRPGESPRSDSGQALHLANLRLQAFQKGGITGCESKTTFNTLGVAIAAASVIAAAVIHLVHF